MSKKLKGMDIAQALKAKLGDKKAEEKSQKQPAKEKSRKQPLVEQQPKHVNEGKVQEPDDAATEYIMKFDPSVFDNPPPSFSDGPTDPNIKPKQNTPPSSENIIDVDETMKLIDDIESKLEIVDGRKPQEAAPAASDSKDSVQEVSQAEAMPEAQAVPAPESEEAKDSVLPDLPPQPAITEVPGGESSMQPVKECAEAECGEAGSGLLLSHLSVIKDENIDTNPQEPAEEATPAAGNTSRFSQDATTVSSRPADERTNRPIYGIAAEVEKLMAGRQPEKASQSDPPAPSIFYDKTTPGEPQIKLGGGGGNRMPPGNMAPPMAQPPAKRPKKLDKWKKWLIGGLVGVLLAANGLFTYLNSRHISELFAKEEGVIAQHLPDEDYDLPRINMLGHTCYYTLSWSFCEKSDMFDTRSTPAAPILDIDDINAIIEAWLRTPDRSDTFEGTVLYTIPSSYRDVVLNSVCFDNFSLTISLNGRKGDTTFMQKVLNMDPCELEKRGCILWPEVAVGDRLAACRDFNSVMNICNNDDGCFGGALANIGGELKNKIKEAANEQYNSLHGNGSCDKRDVILIIGGVKKNVIGYNESEMPEEKNRDCKAPPKPKGGSGFNFIMPPAVTNRTTAQ